MGPRAQLSAEIPTEFAADDVHLIGVSGGRDSVALTHWLRAVGFRRLVICHLDHGLRPESAADAAHVKKFADELGFPIMTKRVDTSATAARRKESLETAARNLRYEFFAEVAEVTGCGRLFLAHHADDQAETFLLQLLRGAGPGGLAGMNALSKRRVGTTDLTISRPLLGVWRDEIDAYVTDHGLAFVEDESNQETRHTRNRIRHVGIPALENAFGREVRTALWRAATLLRAEDEWMNASAELQGLPAELSVRDLKAMPLALQRRVIHRWLHERAVPDVGFDEVEAVRALLEGSSAKTNLPAGLCARRRAKLLFIDQQNPRTSRHSTGD